MSGGRRAEPRVVTETSLEGVPLLRRGKVRDIYDLGERLLIVATDRISAFDCVLPRGIPFKGRVLNRISKFWFDRLRPVIDNHFLSDDPAEYPEACAPHAELLGGRSMMVRRAERIDVECVVRGYLVGSGWREYRESGEVCGIPLPEGLEQAQKLPEPIFTPARKAEEGHDENISFEEMVAMTGEDRAGALRDASLRLYEEAATYAEGRGIIIADTKFEFGLVDDAPILIDEALTPDSSRFWPADRYRTGANPPSFDKQFVRDYLAGLDWNREPPAPDLPDDVVAATSEKYLEAYRLLTGQELPEAPGPAAPDGASAG